LAGTKYQERDDKRAHAPSTRQPPETGRKVRSTQVESGAA
jgi:hypothetical protein